MEHINRGLQYSDKIHNTFLGDCAFTFFIFIFSHFNVNYRYETTHARVYNTKQTNRVFISNRILLEKKKSHGDNNFAVVHVFRSILLRSVYRRVRPSCPGAAIGEHSSALVTTLVQVHWQKNNRKKKKKNDKEEMSKKSNFIKT